MLLIHTCSFSAEYYAYIETSSPRRPGENAKIFRMITLSGKSCLRFYYHMYGAEMGTLRVKLCDAVIFEKTGDQGDQWKMQTIRLQGSGSKEVRIKTRFPIFFFFNYLFSK